MVVGFSDQSLFWKCMHEVFYDIICIGVVFVPFHVEHFHSQSC